MHSNVSGPYALPMCLTLLRLTLRLTMGLTLGLAHPIMDPITMCGCRCAHVATLQLPPRACYACGGHVSILVCIVRCCVGRKSSPEQRTARSTSTAIQSSPSLLACDSVLLPLPVTQPGAQTRQSAPLAL